MDFRPAVPIRAEGPRKGEPSTKTVRYGFRTQPSLPVRGSSRRIMTLRFRPAHISVINRRACFPAVIGISVRKFFLSLCGLSVRGERALSRIRVAAPGASLTKPALHQNCSAHQSERKNMLHPRRIAGLTRSLHISFPKAVPRGRRRDCRAALLWLSTSARVARATLPGASSPESRQFSRPVAEQGPYV